MRHSYLAQTFLILIVAALLGCQAGTQPQTTGELALADEAARLAREVIIIDAHIDLPYRLKEKPADVVAGTEDGHFDYPRARAGCLDAAFMAIYVPATVQGSGTERAVADGLIDLMEELAAGAPDRLRIVSSPGELRASFADGLVAMPLGIENGAAIENDLGALEHFHQRGVRYITLSHSRNNQICDSSFDQERRWNGLSPFGREVIAEMNRLGIMIDISHVTDDTFHQVIELSRAPVIASHSCCRHFTPGFERNISDDMIKQVAEGGGVVHIAFGSPFLDQEALAQSQQAWARVGAYLEEHGLDWDSDEVGQQLDLFFEQNPPVPTGVENVADHIEHVINLVGIDHVGLGSDYDGISNVPVGLEDVSGYPKLIEELLGRGYGEQEIRKICGENLLRVWAEVERIAGEIQAG
jgi:membrane dipeptidase